MHSPAPVPNVPDTYRIPEPAFAEWAFYNIDYPQLVSHALATDCMCCYTMTTDAPACVQCEKMVLACNQQLEK
ncbi:hypothetical protein GGH95_004972, partial [Coemansia sp. RSA 1836]